MHAVGRVFVNGRPAGTGFLAGPGGVALTAAHVVTATKTAVPPFRRIAGPVQLEISGKRVDTEVEIPDESLDIAVLTLAATPAEEPLSCGPTPPLATHQHPDFRLAGCPSGATTQRSVFTGKVVGRDETERLELSPGPPQGMSGGPIIVAGCVVGVQSAGASDGTMIRKEAAASGFQWGYAAALDQLPAEVIARLRWRTTPDMVEPFGSRADAAVPSASTRRMPPVLQIVLSRGPEPGTLSIRRIRGVWGATLDDFELPPAFRADNFGSALQKVLPRLKHAWLRWKPGIFYWNEVVCLVSLPEDSQEYPPFEDSSILKKPCGHKFLCLALSSLDHSGNFTPEVVRLSTEAANAFELELEGSGMVALANLHANRPVAFLGSATATGAAMRDLFDACDELALVVVQQNGAPSELRSKLFGNSDEIELSTLLQRITAARAEGHKLLVMWNDGEFMIEEEDYFAPIGE